MFEYQDRRSSSSSSSSSSSDTHLAAPAQQHSLNDFPPELHKKATLLKHFRKYLMQHQNKPLPTSSSPSSAEAPVLVKRWLRTKHAILFRLSNRAVQVNFMDQTEVILSASQNLAAFTDKAGVRTCYDLRAVLEHCPSPELYRRIKYTKEIVAHLINRK